MKQLRFPVTSVVEPWMRVLTAILLVIAASAAPAAAAPNADLLSASFNSSTDGFSYVDDPFGTNQPSYASGARSTTGGYGATGGLQVTLGGVDANTITGMSGGWSYSLNLPAAEAGVKLSFRYKLGQSATYEYDEYSRVLVTVDGVQYGRGAKNYVDHVGGDGSSSQGSSSSYLPTTDWQQVELYVADLAAGVHTIVLGGYNNKKDASDETTTIVIDDVLLTSGNPAPAATAAEILAGRVDIGQFLAYNRGVAQFDDRCSASNVGCSTPGSTTNYMNAVAYAEAQMQALGLTTFRHAFNYNGNTGTNICGTKLGTVTPTQMYIVSGHLDARSGGDGFDDDGSAVALGLEVARILTGPDVTLDKSVRFCFWDKEEVGLYGAYGYVQDRRALQGTLNEPTWLGVIQHDMILYDHGAGTRTTAQSAYADMDVEWRADTNKAADSMALALKWAHAAGAYAPDYPATAYNYSTNTDDTAFHPYVASVSVRENRRSLTSGGNAEWINPYYHTTSDIESSYTRDDDGDGKRDDIELGYNTVRTTLGLIAELAGAHVAVENTAPVALAQSVTTNEDMPLAITLTGSDAQGDPLTFSVTGWPSQGSLSGTAPNLTYTPNADYSGADGFTFVANDGSLDSEPATVSITVNPVNDPPSANSQPAATDEDTPLAIALTGSDIDGNLLTFSVIGGPNHGALSGVAPALTYTPDENFFGPDSFAFVANDGSVNSAPATVSVTVNPVNDAPVANAQAVSTAQDMSLAITLTGSDLEGDPLTFGVVDAPAYGMLTGTAPDLTYTPAPGYQGTESFTFAVSDGMTTSNPATVYISVTRVNQAPVADAQFIAVAEDGAVGIVLTGFDPDNDPLTYSVVSGPAYGTLAGEAPLLTYTPAADYGGADSFTFRVNDGLADSAPAVVDITVTPANDTPVANGQTIHVAEDASVAIALTGSDIDGDALVFTVVDSPVYGVLSGAAPDLTYTPNPNYVGPDSFTFLVNDNTVVSAVAVVSLNVTPVNDAAVAHVQTVTTDEDTALAITLTGSDVDDDSLTFAVVAAPSQGSLSGTAPNLTYTPAANYHGADSFTFKVNDGTIDSAPAAVSVTVTPVNDAPVANSQSVATQQNAPVAITLTGSDIDVDALSYGVVSGPTNGTLSGTAPDLIYTPATGYTGPDAFTFAASDGMATSDPATVSITVNPAGPVTVFFDDFESDRGWTRNPNGTDTATLGLWERADPEAVDYYGYKQLGTTVSGSYDLVTGPLAGSGAGSYDIDGGVTSIRSPNIVLPAGRELTLSFSYYLANYTNSSSVDYLRVKVVGSTTQTVFEELGAADDDDAAWAIFSGSLDSLGGQTVYLLIEAADADPASLLEAAVDDVLIVAASPNQIPVADAQSISAAEDSAIAITLTGSDGDGDPLTYSVVAGPGHGSLSGTAPDLTYVPAANYNGPDPFTFVVNDGRADSPVAVVSIDVTPVNDAPVADAQSVTTMQDTATSITLTGSDVDGDALTYSVTGGPSHGTLSGVAPILTYTPFAGYSGADSFTFMVNDGTVNSAAATVSVTVNPAVTGPLLYLGSSTSGTAGGVAFADEDVLIKDMATGAWSLYIDGSDVGLANTDIDAFDLQADGSLLLSFDSDFAVSGFATVDDSDIVRFTPASTGATTAGTWSMYFDGSDVGLSTSDEDVDAFTVLPDGRLLVSTLGNVSVTGASGADEDLLVFTPTALGSTTTGTWALYFDGSDVGLSSTSYEDVNGVWVDAAGKIYLTTLGAFSVTGVSGDGSDVFVCTPSSLGSTTRCTFAMYWDGSANGFSGEVTDSLTIVQ